MQPRPPSPFARPSRRSIFLVIGWLSLLGAGCSDDATPSRSQSADASRAARLADAGFLPVLSEASADAGAEALVEPPPTAESLAPRITPVAVDGVFPGALSISFARPIATTGGHAASDDTVLRVEPEVPGTLRLESPSVLRFKPSIAFHPGTEYTAILASVESPGEKLIPTEPWTHSFTTPPFALTGIYGAVVEGKKSGSSGARKARVEAQFSAAVDLDAFREHATFFVDDRRVAASDFELLGNNIVTATLPAPAQSKPSVIRLELSQGLPWAHDESVVAEAASKTVQIQGGEPVEILDLYVAESGRGFYLKVICNDTSLEGHHYYWSQQRRERYYISSRCLPTAEAARDFVEIQPPVSDLQIAAGELGFTISGDFRRDTYTVRFAPGLLTVDGGVLQTTYEQTIDVPARSPSLNFTEAGRYVPRAGWSHAELRHLNVDEVDVSVRHVPRDNLAFWMSGDSEAADARTANMVTKVRLPLDSPDDESATSRLDLGALVPHPKPGVYQIDVSGHGKHAVQRRVVTDLNLIVKRDAPKPQADGTPAPWAEGVRTWVVDMTTSRPIDGATVQVIRKSGQAMDTCRTAADGGCELSLPPHGIDPSGPFAVIATKGDDVTYLKFDELRTTAVDAATGGEPFLSQAPYRAAVYADRDLYRPAETAHLVAVLRDANYRAPSAEVPVKLVVKDPQRKVLREELLRTNDAGVVTLDQPFGDFAPTGGYLVELSVGERTVATHRFQVEEFVPERMEVDADARADDFAATDPFEVEVAAKYLFGGSAEGSTVELDCRLEPADFRPEKHAEYTYGSISSPRPMSLGVTSGVLDDEGRATVTCPTPNTAADFGHHARLVASAAVFEAGSGRTTVDQARAEVHAEPYHLGLKSKHEKAKRGEEILVDGVVVDRDGELYAGLDEVQVEQIRLDWHYYYWHDDDDGDTTFGGNVRPFVVDSRAVPVKGGRFQVRMTPKERAQGYVVRVSAGKEETLLRFDTDYRSYWWNGGSSDHTPRPTRATAVAIEAPKNITAGEPATVNFEAPFRGRALFTVETHEVVHQEWRDVEAGPGKWSFTLEGFEPNVYVTALVIKDPFLDSEQAFLPDRAFGVESVPVRPAGKLHELRVSAPKEVEPNSRLEVDLDLGAKPSGPTYATVAVVDEGILQLTDYDSPDPADDLFAARALGVETFETVGWAVPYSPAGPSGRTGGGDYEEEEADAGMGRVMPIKPVAMWSGLVDIGPDGKARVGFDVPRYRGKLRVMAVAVSGEKTGAAEAHVTVRDPLVLQTTLPRFLSAGDEVEIPVFVTNMTGAPREISVSLEAEEIPTSGLVPFEADGPVIAFTGADAAKVAEPTRTISLDAGESGAVVFGARALKEAGAARFRVQASAGEIVSFDEATVPFRPSGPTERRLVTVPLKPGENDLSKHLTGWVPTSERSTIWVSAIPSGEAFDHLKYLARYPYGCIEQTTSSTRPLLYVSSLVELNDPASVKKGGGVAAMVKHGIDRVLSMQTSSGGFGYWPGDDHPVRWGTAYATHMLLDARDAGFAVPKGRLDDALDYLEGETSGRNSYYGDRPGGEAYMHYVLARGGRGNKAKMLKELEALPETRTGQQKEQAYMLQAALYMAGDRRYRDELFELDTTSLGDTRESRYTYYSDARRRGFMLSTFLDTFSSDSKSIAAAAPLATMLATFLSRKTSARYTTQELMWGITGLGKWIAGRSADFPPPTLVAAGKAVTPSVAPANRGDRSWAVHRASEYPSLVVSMAEPEDDKERKVYALISSEGVRKGAEAKTGGEGLSIERTFHDHEGNEIEPDEIALGDLVFVKLTVRNTTYEKLDNLALVDRFPAGFEVENPRLGRGTLPDWVDQNRTWAIDHMNVRDDRLEAFGSLGEKSTVELIYAARATSAGRFQAPPPAIDGMYDPGYWARAKPAMVEVQGNWAELVD